VLFAIQHSGRRTPSRSPAGLSVSALAAAWPVHRGQHVDGHSGPAWGLPLLCNRHRTFTLREDAERSRVAQYSAGESSPFGQQGCSNLLAEWGQVWGNSRDVIEALFWHLPVATQSNRGELQSWSSSNSVLPEYSTRAKVFNLGHTYPREEENAAYGVCKID
jgi:hypothetical protein